MLDSLLFQRQDADVKLRENSTNRQTTRTCKEDKKKNKRVFPDAHREEWKNELCIASRFVWQPERERRRDSIIEQILYKLLSWYFFKIQRPLRQFHAWFIATGPFHTVFRKVLEYSSSSFCEVVLALEQEGTFEMLENIQGKVTSH